MIRPRYFSDHVQRNGKGRKEGSGRNAHERVRIALGVVKEWEKSAEEGSFDCEVVVCATRHSAKSTSQATRGVLRQLISLTIALSRGPPSPE
jgi:hypothetical protein